MHAYRVEAHLPREAPPIAGDRGGAVGRRGVERSGGAAAGTMVRAFARESAPSDILDPFESKFRSAVRADTESGPIDESGH